MLHARIVRPPSYHCKLIKINEDFKKRLDENEIELFIKGSFVAILSLDEFLVIKFLEIAKKTFFGKKNSSYLIIMFLVLLKNMKKIHC